MPDYRVYHGDCLNVMRDLKTEGTRVHSVVTDPPYHFASIVSRFGKKGSAPTVDQGVFKRVSQHFMEKDWDGGDIAFDADTWRCAYDVLYPGGHLLAFAATKNYHRMACAIEDAGFEIRDQIGWLYGTGLPKSHKVGGGWRTALKPSWEPICVARKPISEKTISQNMRVYEVGGLNIDGCRVDGKFPGNIIQDGSEPLRYFYHAKASEHDRVEGSKHPTVKPIALMKYLTRLVTPIGGTVLDPFAGTGTTLQAAYEQDFNSIGIERDEEYHRDILKRMAAVTERGKLDV